MIRRFILKKLDKVERDLGAPTEYLKQIVRISLPAFFRFAAFMPLAAYRRKLPAPACHVARIVATRSADCGTCVQIAVNLARKDAVAPEVLRAAVDGRPDDLPADLAVVYRFAEVVMEKTGEEGSLRDQIRTLYGDEGLIELALAIASCQVFPITKRAMGYAVSCARVAIQV